MPWMRWMAVCLPAGFGVSIHPLSAIGCDPPRTEVLVAHGGSGGALSAYGRVVVSRRRDGPWRAVAGRMPWIFVIQSPLTPSANAP